MSLIVDKSSYLEEIKCFINALNTGEKMPVNGEDGLKAMIIAEAANKSLLENRPVKIN